MPQGGHDLTNAITEAGKRFTGKGKKGIGNWELGIGTKSSSCPRHHNLDPV